MATLSAAALSSTERRQVLLDWIEQRRRASLPEIMEEFGISPATARRDLEALAEAGQVQRVRGAVLAKRPAPPEAPVNQRSAEQPDEKARIAAAVAGLIGDGETLFLGSGTTVEAVAQRLTERRGLTVVTNSLPVLNALASAPGVTLVSLGGTLRPTELSLIGPLTMRALSDLRAIRVVMGIRAIDVEQGLTNAYLDESLIDRAILETAGDVIIAADHTKCGRVSTVFVAHVDKVTTLVTDQAAPEPFVHALRTRGITVLTV
jgi:DeoR/GlpR family transcriptional regulator of sugar metabolism